MTCSHQDRPSPRSAPRRGEAAFSLVEVIIALVILSIVVSGAAVAVTSSDSAEVRTKAVADSHAMAEKAMERLQSDLSALGGCDSGGWNDVARQVKVSSSAAAASFARCQVNYLDMRDSKGRSYGISLEVTPKDLPVDGLGADDSDGNLRDRYEVATTVQLAAGSRAGRQTAEPITVAGSVDWKGGSTDDATVKVVSCGLDRPDRALVAGGCSAGDTSRQPLQVPIQATRIMEETGAQVPAGTITGGAQPAPLTPGSYRFTAPASYAGFTLLKLDPADLRVAGSQSYTIYATYVRNAMTVRVCTQINNWTPPDDDGYEVLNTNLHYRRTHQPGYRSTQLTFNEDRSWNCTGVAGSHTLHDPVESVPQNMYRGLYDLEVEQVLDHYTPHKGTDAFGPSAFQVSEMKLNCQLNPWNAAIGGTDLITRTADTMEAPNTIGWNMDSFYRRLAITATTGTQTICLRANSKQFKRVRCVEHADGTYDAGCFYTGTECGLPPGIEDNDDICANGAEVGGNGAPQVGTVGAFDYQTESGGISGGPNDSTVACTSQPGYSWPGSRFPAAGIGTDVPKSTFMPNTWIGGDSFYYSNYSGRVMARKDHPYGVSPDAATYNLPDNPPFHCADVYFTAGKQLLKGEYPLYTCIEVYVPGRPNLHIRGRVLDQSGTGTTLFTTIAGGRFLAGNTGRIEDYWNPFGGGADSFPAITGGGNWPDYKVAKVKGDPVCNSGGGPVHYDPIIVEVWKKIVDDPAIYPLAPPATATNLGTDKVGV
ncbi:MAG: hypothetical protein JWM98_1273 [Thermoleophilia bacterium]|nr:hypothetical protein [Thermoleophilia bacterium]